MPVPDDVPAVNEVTTTTSSPSSSSVGIDIDTPPHVQIDATPNAFFQSPSRASTAVTPTGEEDGDAQGHDILPTPPTPFPSPSNGPPGGPPGGPLGGFLGGWSPPSLFHATAVANGWPRTNGYFNPYVAQDALNADGEFTTQDFATLENLDDVDVSFDSPQGSVHSPLYHPFEPSWRPVRVPLQDKFDAVPQKTMESLLQAAEKEGEEGKEDNGKKEGIDEDPIICAICCEDFQLTDLLCVPACGHMFHPQCLQRWMRHQATCPLCRQSLGP